MITFRLETRESLIFVERLADSSCAIWDQISMSGSIRMLFDYKYTFMASYIVYNRCTRLWCDPI